AERKRAYKAEKHGSPKNIGKDLRRFSEQQADKNNADSHTRCGNAHVDYGCEQIPRQVHFTASSMIRFSSSASCSESLRPLRKAVRNFGSDPSNVFSSTALLSYLCTSSRFPNAVTVASLFCRIPRTQSFFSTVYVVDFF